MSGRKVRPCKKGCGYPAAKGRQFCHWHVLMRSSSDVQAAASRARLARLANPEATRSRVPESEWPLGERWCAGCQSFVPLFYCSGSRCKACASLANHAARLEKVYGIDADEYARILKAQGGRCAICRNQPRTIRFAVDHDHKTGEVRGILCKRCNHDLLGGGHDDVEVLWNAIAYLLDPPAQRVGLGPRTEDLMNLLRARLHTSRRLRELQRSTPRPPPF